MIGASPARCGWKVLEGAQEEPAKSATFVLVTWAPCALQVAVDHDFLRDEGACATGRTLLEPHCWVQDKTPAGGYFYTEQKYELAKSPAFAHFSTKGG